LNADVITAAVAELVTPVAVVDEALMEANLRRMAALAESADVRLRPHAKTHKSAHVARRQLAHGAVGLTVATLHEAEVFAAAGIRDLLVAHPPATQPKLRQLAALAERVSRLAVAVDDAGIASALPPKVEFLWEVDTGQHRIGTAPGKPTVKAVRELVAAIGNDRFRGLITHGGHVYSSKDQLERRAVADQEAGGLVDTAAMLRADGIEVRELSIGSTPTAGVASMDGITEMRPGTYVYGDVNQVRLGAQLLEQCALAVVACVVSTPAADRAVVDAGSKALSADFRAPGVEGFGIVVGKEHLIVERLSEEHAVLVARGATGLSIGDLVVIIPVHACTTVNLHPALAVLATDGRIRWQPVDARGWR
jgi:D-serine deaminase-like pyridoxal phosphate-dependent protein